MSEWVGFVLVILAPINDAGSIRKPLREIWRVRPRSESVHRRGRASSLEAVR